MESQFKNLYITPEDLKQIAGISQRDFKAYEKLKYPRLALIVMTADHIFSLWGLIPLFYLIKWKCFRKGQTNILREVDKYNTVVKIIDINLQLEAAGNKQAILPEKDKIIASLQSIKESLVCAFKTERILRTNQAFITRNQDLLPNYLAALQALQLNPQADNYAITLKEGLQIAQEIEMEIKKLEEG
ncbi:MAG: hypothetical protein MJK14_24640 [Rivularia sp. ALOHA_DT_140]|nr:hypothetical protein [Rivularia sp. ALOHA_DT_140]